MHFKLTDCTSLVPQKEKKNKTTFLTNVKRHTRQFSRANFYFLFLSSTSFYATRCKQAGFTFLLQILHTTGLTLADWPRAWPLPIYIVLLIVLVLIVLNVLMYVLLELAFELDCMTVH